MKLKYILPLLVFPIGFSTIGCKNNKPSITYTVTKIDPQFRSFTFDKTPQEFNDAGFTYGDIIDVTFKNLINNNQDYSIEVPYVYNYNEAGAYTPCVVDFENKSDAIEFSPQLNQSIIKNEDTLKGKEVTFTLKKKGGFLDTINLLKCPSKLSLEDVGGQISDYVNFRDVSDIKDIYPSIYPQMLYRGSSSFNAKSNGPDRYRYVDEFLERNNIDYIINLAMEQSKAEQMIDDLYFKSKTDCVYTHELKDLGHFYSYNLGNDFFSEGKCKDDARDVFRTIANFPYNTRVYLHCNEGKDRTGFFIMVLEALCGCSYESIVYDYMTTFKNYYNISPATNKESYEKLYKSSLDRYILAMCERNIDITGSHDYLNFDVENELINKYHINENDALKENAENYLLFLGVSKDEINSLKVHFKYFLK